MYKTFSCYLAEERNGQNHTSQATSYNFSTDMESSVFHLLEPVIRQEVVFLHAAKAGFNIVVISMNAHPPLLLLKCVEEDA
jgi:hypothetical protein